MRRDFEDLVGKFVSPNFRFHDKRKVQRFVAFEFSFVVELQNADIMRTFEAVKVIAISYKAVHNLVSCQKMSMFLDIVNHIRIVTQKKVTIFQKIPKTEMLKEVMNSKKEVSNIQFGHIKTWRKPCCNEILKLKIEKFSTRFSH